MDGTKTFAKEEMKWLQDRVEAIAGKLNQLEKAVEEEHKGL